MHIFKLQVMPVRGIKLGDSIHLKVSHLDWKFYVDNKSGTFYSKEMSGYVFFPFLWIVAITTQV